MANEVTYSPDVILNGNRVKQEGQEMGSATGEMSGVSQGSVKPSLANKSSTRMAGQMGEFAQNMMQNKQLANTVQQWNGMFSQSVPGMQFNQAKIMMAQAKEGGADKQKQQQQNKPKPQQKQPVRKAGQKPQQMNQPGGIA